MGYYDMGMTDDDFLSAFEAGRIHPHDFPHEAHVRAAWLLLREPDGYERLAAGLRTIAARAGRPEKFHETITRAWFELVRGADALVPELYDRTLLSRFYSPERLAAGRDRWVEPDLRPLRLAPADGADRADVVRDLREVRASGRDRVDLADAVRVGGREREPRAVGRPRQAFDHGAGR
jgi:hypothetical protein